MSQIEGADRPQITGQASREEMDLAKKIVGKRASYLGTDTEEYAGMLTMVVEGIRAGEARGMTRRSIFPEASAVSDQSTVRTTRRSSGILAFTAIFGLTAAVIGGAAVFDNSHRTQEAERINQSRLGLEPVQLSPSWQAQYLPRDRSTVYEPIPDSSLKIPSGELLRLSKTDPDLITDVRVRIFKQGSLRPYWFATELYGLAPDERKMLRAYLRDVPDEMIDTQMVMFRNRSTGREVVASLKGYHEGGVETTSYMEVIPTRIKV